MVFCPCPPAASVLALSVSAAGRAVAETVTPSGSGVPVAGGASGSTISVDGAVNQLIDAIKAGSNLRGWHIQLCSGSRPRVDAKGVSHACTAQAAHSILPQIQWY